MDEEKRKIDVAAYVWPSYTGDEPRTRIFWPEGIGEWQSVHHADQKRPDYKWDRRPLWGYVNEADPDIMSMEIDVAAAHGVDVFIYDWYWYDHRPFLEQCLDHGFLGARNRDRMKFYLMWANHDATHLWHKDLADSQMNDVIWQGGVDRREFEIIVHRVIDRYFTQPNYYRIDGRPVFMIFDFCNLVKGLGGLADCRKALDYFRDETVKAGFPGLHLQCVAVERDPSLAVDESTDGRWRIMSRAQFKELGFDGLTNYQYYWWMKWEKPDYMDVMELMCKEWRDLDDEYGGIFVPNVAIGWDNNPRYHRWCPCNSINSTPENFEKGLLIAKDYLEAHPGKPRLVTVNSWNEWTETSYLEPDNLHGYGNLEAVKRVFG